MNKALVVGLLGFVAAAPLQAGNLPYTQSDFGGVGLLQMPSARMDDEGEIGFYISDVDPYTRGGVVMQPFPWMEALFRYTSVDNRFYGRSIAGDQDYKDKGFDLKLRLLEEDYYWPQVAVGFRDVGGTGQYSSEYLVASKQYGNFDFTLGMGWGYMASRGGIRNPLTSIHDAFKTRSAQVGRGGTFSIEDYFSGEEVTLFGGVEYYLPWAPLIIKAEYDGNDYQHEPQSNNQPVKTPINLGLVYQVNSAIDLSLGWERGDTLMLGFTVKSNLGGSPGQPKISDPDPVAYRGVAPELPTEIDTNRLVSELHSEAGHRVDKLYDNGRELVVVGTNERYLNQAKSIGRASRILVNDVPERIEWFTFVEEDQGVALDQVSIERQKFEGLLQQESTLSELWVTTEQVRPAYEADQLLYERDPSAFHYWVGPDYTQSLGGPDGFILYEVSALADAEWYLQQNSWFSGTVSAALFGNFDKFKYTAPSKLPRVRTYIREYLTTSDVRMSNLQFTHFENFGGDWFGLGYGGYLETMYGGVGAEVMYAPYGEDWAVGADLNYVRQRAFDMQFGFRDYTTLTGHGTLYYRMPWLPGSLARISVGRYLAKDLGATFDLSRTFDNGVTFGAWATFTNVSAEQFGEGSFDKGVYVSLPMDLFYTKSTTRSTLLGLNFLTRDGGQRLNRRYSLGGLFGRGDRSALKAGFGEVLD